MRPKTVSAAVILLYASLGLGGVRLLLNSRRLTEAFGDMPVLWLILLVLLAMIVGLYQKIGNGRNWARITLLVLCIVSVPMGIPDLISQVAARPASAILGLLQVMLNIGALVLLFLPQSRNWFSSRHGEETMKTKEAFAIGIGMGFSLLGCIPRSTAGVVHLLTMFIAIDQAGFGAGVVTLFLPVLAEGYWFIRLGPLSGYGIIIMVWLGLVIVGYTGFWLVVRQSSD